MTPEERAAQVFKEMYGPFFSGDPIQAIATAIREAVEAERQRCSKVALRVGQDRNDIEFGSYIATAIRHSY